MIYIKEQIWELAKLRVVRNIEWKNNSKIANFCGQTLILQIEKILKFLNFSIWTIPKTSSLRNPKNFQFGKFEKFASWQIQKNSIWKFPEICNLANSKNLHFLKYKKFPKFFNFKKPQISKILQFRTTRNFQNTAIWKTIKIPRIYNFINYRIFWMFE